MSLPGTWKKLLDVKELVWEISENSHNGRKWLTLSFYVGLSEQHARECGEITWVTEIGQEQAEMMIDAYLRIADAIIEDDPR